MGSTREKATHCAFPVSHYPLMVVSQILLARTRAGKQRFAYDVGAGVNFGYSCTNRTIPDYFLGDFTGCRRPP
ncbi:MAG: hypothetical protein KC418_20035 [Anaerolineales bacterium]|nr:hypothetical protein [Anaerolineales bacterium]MCB8952154.1 hypothetical protein [Ardenticatenales bacterium]